METEEFPKESTCLNTIPINNKHRLQI